MAIETLDPNPDPDTFEIHNTARNLTDAFFRLGLVSGLLLVKQEL